MLRDLLNCCPLIDDFIIEHCRLLTKIELTDMRISEGFLQRLISTSQFLERLILDYVSAMLERFKICGSPSLKLLAIENCKGLQEIDAITRV
uniref:Isoform 1 of F-box/LRR-repeat protein n=1 Tax=Solanum tuberosum TaxID=4113 RepID=M0ZV55_SOLTU